MTRENPTLRHSFLTITDSMLSISKLSVSSTPTVQECTLTTVASYRISLCRHCAAEDITVYGEGQQTRSFCYVDDLIDGMLLMMTPDVGFTGPVNLGNATEFTILQLAETVLRLTSSRSKIVYRPLPSDDPRQRQPDLSLARSVLQWEPRTPAGRWS